jgi:hypothetical protein
MRALALAALAAITATIASSAVVAQPTTINVEIDYMQGAGHDHAPTQAEIDAVIQMFACQGITLNVLLSDAIPEVAVIQCANPGTDDFFVCTGPNTFADLKATWQSETGGGWHYAIYGHRYDDGDGTDSSGIAEISGDDLLVTLGAFTGEIGTDWDRAASLAHELGHNLGLRHYGLGSTGTNAIGDFQPNYASIMSYQYHLRGVRTMMLCLGMIDETSHLKDLDYSHGRMAGVIEAEISEIVGVGVQSVDWNCDRHFDTVPFAQDIDHNIPFCGSTGQHNTLRDYDDWSNIEDVTTLARVDPLAVAEVTRCLSRTERDELDLKRWADPTMCTEGSSAQPPVTVEACNTEMMIFVNDNYVGIEQGTGWRPFNTVQEALESATPGSAIYLQPGMYDNDNESLIITDKVTLSGPGTAIIDP